MSLSCPLQPYSVVIVTHNSQAYLGKCIESIKSQTILPEKIVIVDNASDSIEFLEDYKGAASFQLILNNQNLGFCKANNRGYAAVPPASEYVLFLNPDAFLTPSFMEQALSLMANPKHATVGALSGLLMGYDITTQQPTGQVDSTGIFSTWYGHWYDRDQGQNLNNVQRSQEIIPAICGALMLCRRKALETICLQPPYEIFSSSFFMYKEDIDLSLRLRKQGWSLLFDPSLLAYHCRGWKKNRKEIPKSLRLLSAKNEMLLHANMKSPCFLYSLLKYLAVKCLNF